MRRVGTSRSGLVFELGGGLLVDTAGNNTVTNNGATLTADHNGRANRGFLFPKTTNTEHILIGDNDDYNFGTDAFTINIAYKDLGNTNTSFAYFGKYVDVNNYWGVFFRPVSNFALFRYMIGGVSRRLQATTPAMYNNYNYITFSVGRTANAIYANGVNLALAFNEVDTADISFASPLRLGSSNLFDWRAFESDYASIFQGRAITLSEHQKLYNYWRSH